MSANDSPDQNQISMRRWSFFSSIINYILPFVQYRMSASDTSEREAQIRAAFNDLQIIDRNTTTPQSFWMRYLAIRHIVASEPVRDLPFDDSLGNRSTLLDRLTQSFLDLYAPMLWSDHSNNHREAVRDYFDKILQIRIKDRLIYKVTGELDKVQQETV